MRIRPALVAGALALAPFVLTPPAARAQAGPPAFAEVFRTDAFAGCYDPGLSQTPASPCVRGTATFGRLAAETVGVRFDVTGDFSGLLGVRDPVLRNAYLATESRFEVSTVVSGGRAECFGFGTRLVAGRCVQLLEGLGRTFGSPDLVGGETATFLFTRTVGGASPELLGAPETLRLEAVDLIYQLFDVGGPFTRRVRPAVTPADLTPVPEPTTVALTGAGVLALGAWARRRRQA